MIGWFLLWCLLITLGMDRAGERPQHGTGGGLGRRNREGLGSVTVIADSPRGLGVSNRVIILFPGPARPWLITQLASLLPRRWGLLLRLEKEFVS
ncbi:hypothetical protein B0I37DRAFT_387518 [Chaetomium sp. MPI-CAGE-AT-0009]|nr:hypothetical protein B0I37DRAFT_387518 [Chaetomium sp. MPI-CAGE-AT-0009]